MRVDWIWQNEPNLMRARSKADNRFWPNEPNANAGKSTPVAYMTETC